MSIRSFHVRHAGDVTPGETFDAQVMISEILEGQKAWPELLPLHISQGDREVILELVKRLEAKIEPGKILSFDRTPLLRWTLALVDVEMDMFRYLGLARQILKPLKDHRCRHIQVDLSALSPDRALALIDALVSALRIQQFKAPRYQSKSEGKKDSYQPQLEFLCPADLDLDRARTWGASAELKAEGSNLVRHLVMQAGNDLTPKRYVQLIKQQCEKEGLSFEFINQKKLTAMNAGAFLAVVQGAAHEDAGIVKLSYEPAKKKGVKHVCLVGKGVTFDTGGTNLKPANYMWGMHRDMAGSAVAYALIRLAMQEKWPVKVTAFLAIAENATGPQAYRQNDVVTALNGKTIEIVHTDAEGRMLLADTLHLASEEKPDLIVDFATLTGACVAAISTQYSGAFTNRADYHSAIISAGKTTGERVWPFPLEPDFAECLKSDTADIKQCRLTGGVDHIEAALFLKEFIGAKVPWIHVDLSAAENSGGLAHVDTEATGFGVRFGAQLVQELILKAVSEQVL
jgi:leucyl aminopeptidase